MAKLYIVVTRMSAGNNTKERETLSETEVKLTYCLTESQRKAVNAVRNKYRNRIVRNNSLTLHSLVICNEEQKKQVEAELLEADQEMKKLRARIYKDILYSYGDPAEYTDEIRELVEDINVPVLHASAEFFPLDSGEMAKGKLYDELVNAIRVKVFDVAFSGVEPIFEITDGKQIPGRTTTALIKMCNRLQTFNILDDEYVTEKIKEIRELIEKESFEPLRQVLEEERVELAKVSGRAAAVEF